MPKKTWVCRLVNAEGEPACPDCVITQHQCESIIQSHMDNGWTPTDEEGTIKFTRGKLDHTCILFVKTE